MPRADFKRLACFTQEAQKRLHLRRTHVLPMALVVEQDEAARPVDIGAHGVNGRMEQCRTRISARSLSSKRGNRGGCGSRSGDAGVAAAGRLEEPMPRSGYGLEASSGWESIRRFLGVPLQKSLPRRRATTKRVYEEKCCDGGGFHGQNGTTVERVFSLSITR